VSDSYNQHVREILNKMNDGILSQGLQNRDIIHFPTYLLGFSSWFIIFFIQENVPNMIIFRCPLVHTYMYGKIPRIHYYHRSKKITH